MIDASTHTLDNQAWDGDTAEALHSEANQIIAIHFRCVSHVAAVSGFLVCIVAFSTPSIHSPSIGWLLCSSRPLLLTSPSLQSPQMSSESITPQIQDSILRQDIRIIAPNYHCQDGVASMELAWKESTESTIRSNTGKLTHLVHAITDTFLGNWGTNSPSNKSTTMRMWKPSQNPSREPLLLTTTSHTHNNDDMRIPVGWHAAFQIARPVVVRVPSRVY